MTLVWLLLLACCPWTNYAEEVIMVRTKPGRYQTSPMVMYKELRQKDKAEDRKGPQVRVEAVVKTLRTSVLSIELLCFAGFCIMVELPLALIVEVVLLAYDKSEEEANFWIVFFTAVIVWGLVMYRISQLFTWCKRTCNPQPADLAKGGKHWRAWAYDIVAAVFGWKSWDAQVQEAFTMKRTSEMQRRQAVTKAAPAERAPEDPVPEPVPEEPMPEPREQSSSSSTQRRSVPEVASETATAGQAPPILQHNPLLQCYHCKAYNPNHYGQDCLMNPDRRAAAEAYPSTRRTPEDPSGQEFFTMNTKHQALDGMSFRKVYDTNPQYVKYMRSASGLKHPQLLRFKAYVMQRDAKAQEMAPTLG